MLLIISFMLKYHGTFSDILSTSAAFDRMGSLIIQSFIHVPGLSLFHSLVSCPLKCLEVFV